MASSGPFATLMHFLYLLSTTTDLRCHLHLCPYPVWLSCFCIINGHTEVTQNMPECLDSSGCGCGIPPAHQDLGSLRLCHDVQENPLPPEKSTAVTSGKGPKHPLIHQQRNVESRRLQPPWGQFLVVQVPGLEPILDLSRAMSFTDYLRAGEWLSKGVLHICLCL